MTQVLAVFQEEWRRIFALRPAFSVLVLAIIIYSVFYPQPYLHEALRKVPIAVVDWDDSVSSRTLIRRLDATADVSVDRVLPDLVTAQRAVFTRDISGILVIPQYFERELLHGRPSPIALYADASYFLLFQRVYAGVSAVARMMGAEVEAARLIATGVDPAQAPAVADPLVLTLVPLFNPQGGYATYVLPAAFILILQQTLLIGVGLLGTLPPPAPTAGNRAAAAAGPLTTVLGKLTAYLTLQMLILPFYLVALPYLYGVPRLGSVTTILALALPFVLSVGSLGLVVASIFRKPITVQLVFATLGLPLFFLAGFSWPAEAIPQAIRDVALLIPSSSAIDGLVRVAQLGAPLSDVRQQFLTLWGLTFLYGILALLLEARKRRSRTPSPAQQAL